MTMRDDADEEPAPADGVPQAMAPDVPGLSDEGGAHVIKRSVAIAGHRTSISLEAPFWEALRELAARRGRSLQRLVAEIDAARGPANLSSAIRVRLLAEARAGALPRTNTREGVDEARPALDAPHVSHAADAQDTPDAEDTPDTEDTPDAEDTPEAEGSSDTEDALRVKNPDDPQMPGA